MNPRDLFGPTPASALISFVVGVCYVGLLVTVGFMDAYPGAVS